jgi:hypothetical protein
VPSTPTVPILQSHLSLVISKLVFKGVSQCTPAVSVLYFGPFNPFHCSPLSLYLTPPLFNSFQYTSLYPPPVQMWCMSILLTLYHSLFLSLLFWVPEWFHCYKCVLHMSVYMIMFVFVYMFIFGSVFHIWEKTCSLCLPEPGLLHVTWCPPIASIYFQTLCRSSLWLTNTPLCIYSTFSHSIHQLWTPGLCPYLGCAVMNIGVQCLYCILYCQSFISPHLIRTTHSAV